MPFGRSIHASYWHVASADVPVLQEERVEWLNRQWEMVDGWITGNRVTAIGEAET